jgi:signal transduction histidine kinase
MDESAEGQAILDAIPTPVVLVGADGRLAGSNIAARELFAILPTIAYVHELLPFLPKDPRQVRRRTRWQGAVTNRAGRELRMEVGCALLEDGAKPHRYLYVLHDVSQLVEATWWREQILYTLAHEIGGSFAVLRNALELLSIEPSAGDTLRLIRTAQRTISKGEFLMEGLLAAGSMRGGRFQVHLQPTRLAELVEESAEGMAPEIESRGQTVRLALPQADSWVKADPHYVGQVLFNLIRNASKYSPRGSVIRVSTRASSRRWVRISVEDEGQGIPRDELRWVFERFYRVKPGSPEAGIGLGLAITRGIVQAHGGRMGLASKMGRGTTVWFTLALADPPNSCEHDLDALGQDTSGAATDSPALSAL